MMISYEISSISVESGQHVCNRLTHSGYHSKYYTEYNSNHNFNILVPNFDYDLNIIHCEFIISFYLTI